MSPLAKVGRWHISTVGRPIAAVNCLGPGESGSPPSVGGEEMGPVDNGRHCGRENETCSHQSMEQTWLRCGPRPSFSTCCPKALPQGHGPRNLLHFLKSKHGIKIQPQELSAPAATEARKRPAARAVLPPGAHWALCSQLSWWHPARLPPPSTSPPRTWASGGGGRQVSTHMPFP